MVNGFGFCCCDTDPFPCHSEAWPNYASAVPLSSAGGLNVLSPPDDLLLIRSFNITRQYTEFLNFPPGDWLQYAYNSETQVAGSGASLASTLNPTQRQYVDLIKQTSLNLHDISTISVSFTSTNRLSTVKSDAAEPAFIQKGFTSLLSLSPYTAAGYSTQRLFEIEHIGESLQPNGNPRFGRLRSGITPANVLISSDPVAVIETINVTIEINFLGPSVHSGEFFINYPDGTQQGDVCSFNRPYNIVTTLDGVEFENVDRSISFQNHHLGILRVSHGGGPNGSPGAGDDPEPDIPTETSFSISTT